MFLWQMSHVYERELCQIVFLNFKIRPFEYLILLTIFANCIALAVYTPYPCGDSDNTNVIVVSFFFTISFYIFKNASQYFCILFLGSYRKCFSSNIHIRMYHENISLWFYRSLRSLLTERMEFTGLHHRCNRVCFSLKSL